MKANRLIAGAVACLALAVAAPAAAAPREISPAADQGQALSPELVPGAGLSGVAGAQATIKHVVRGQGFVGNGAALFRIDLGTSSATVLYADPLRHVTFRSLHLDSVRFADNSAKLRGVGVVNNRRVSFTVVAVHNELPGIDVFRIAWHHGPALGGRVVRGNVFIR